MLEKCSSDYTDGTSMCHRSMCEAHDIPTVRVSRGVHCETSVQLALP